MWRPTPPPGAKYKKHILKDLIKTTDFIYQIGESRSLRQPSREVDIAKISSPEYKAKFRYLKKCMREYRRRTGKGRGIAAVQVGIPEKFFILYKPEQQESLQLFINPKITKVSKTLYRYPEVCMSCNGLVANVVRPAWIEFTYHAEDRKEKTWTLKDTTKKGRMYNRVVQHEIDHLEGIINIDKVPSRDLIFEIYEDFYKKATFEKV
jgi:peptide deformylase